jgi:hypothetical protein
MLGVPETDTKLSRLHSLIAAGMDGGFDIMPQGDSTLKVFRCAPAVRKQREALRSIDSRHSQPCVRACVRTSLPAFSLNGDRGVVGISIGLESAPLRPGDTIFLGKGENPMRKLLVEYTYGEGGNGTTTTADDVADEELARAIQNSLHPSSSAGGDEDLALAMQASLQQARPAGGAVAASGPAAVSGSGESRESGLDDELAKAIGASLQTSSQAGGNEDLAFALQ